MGKKGKKKGKEIVIDAVLTEELVGKALIPVAVAVYEEILREIEQAEMFKLERSRIKYDWEIDRKKEEELISKLVSSEKTKEDLHAESQSRISSVTHKAKHVAFEMCDKLTNFKTNCQKNYQNINEAFKLQEDQLAREKNKILFQMKEQAIGWGEKFRLSNLGHASDINDIKDDFERNLKEYVSLNELDLQKALTDHENRRVARVIEIETKRTEQINDLLQKHKNELENLRMYYNNILSNNLSMIDTLKQESEDLLAVSERQKSRSNEAVTRYNNVCEKFTKVQETIAKFESESKDLEEYQTQLELVNARYNNISKGKISLLWSNAMLEQICDRVDQQKDELKKSDERLIMDVERKKAFKFTVQSWNKILNCVNDNRVRFKSNE